MNKTCMNRHPQCVCKILSVRACPDTNCPFFQTEEAYNASRAKAHKLLASLDAPTQRHIAEKYYGGKTPWLEGGACNDR